MGSKLREVIWSGAVMGASMRAQEAREAAQKAMREADRAEAYAWSVRMAGYGGPAQPSPTIGQCISGGYGWLEVKCHRCDTRASLPLDAIRRPRDTPIWKLEAALKCRSCRKGRYAPPVHMIKLTERQAITGYKWVHADEERQERLRSPQIEDACRTSPSRHVFEDGPSAPSVGAAFLPPDCQACSASPHKTIALPRSRHDCWLMKPQEGECSSRSSLNV